MTTLILKSSILGEYSQSNMLIDAALEGKTHLIERDLVANPLPMLDGQVIAALNGNFDELPEAQQAILALSNQLIDELKTADQLIVAAPMYNYMVPTQLKNWFDLIARAGVTFSYTEQGPVGLVTNKKVIVVTTRGGLHKDSPRTSLESYVSTMFDFIGITDVHFVYAEALNLGDEAARNSREQALTELHALL